MKNPFVLLFVLLFIFVNSQFAHSQWIQNYNGPGNNFDLGRSIAADESGNVYITGMSDGGDSGEDYITIKYNSSGVQLWEKRYSGAGHFRDEALSLALDDSGNVYVTGNSYSAATDLDIVTIKYNTSGQEQWLKRFDGTGHGWDVGSSIELDNSGNVYVAGFGVFNSIEQDFVTIKYNSNGDLVWSRNYNGPGNGIDEVYSMAVDIPGNVYVTGRSEGSGSGQDYATLKYNSSGDLLWVQRYNGPGNDFDHSYSIAADVSGNLYVTGTSKGSEENYDYATIKYNSDGDTLWVQRYSGTTGLYNLPRTVKTDDQGNVYVAGTCDDDCVTIKYSSIGTSLWVQKYNGDGDGIDEPLDMEFDKSGNVYLTGYSTGVGTGIDFITIKYNTDGPVQWIKRYDGSSSVHDAAYALTIDNTGNVYVTGISFENGTSDLTTIKYSQKTDLTLDLTCLIEGLYDSVNDVTIKDTVTVYLRSRSSPYFIEDSAIAVLDSNGHGIFNFQKIINGLRYYVVIKHRNSAQTWSSGGQLFNGNKLSYDFTISENNAYGNNMVLKGNKYCIYSGDVNQDREINLDDVVQIYNDAVSSATGYNLTDLDGNNLTDFNDVDIAYNNSLNFVNTIIP